MVKRVEGIGPVGAKLMVIGEAAGAKEEELGYPFAGPTGKLVDNFLTNAGLSRDEVYLTNVIKVRPPDNKIKRLPEIGFTVDDFVPELFNEIRAIKPNCILTLGNIPLEKVAGKANILKYRGSLLRSIDGMFKVVPTIHPAALLHKQDHDSGGGVFKQNARFYMQLDFNRAVEESSSPNLDLPLRTIQICRSASDLLQYLHSYEKELEPAVDIETWNSIPDCLGIAFHKSHAMCIPLHQIKAFKDGRKISDEELNIIWRILQEDFFDKPGLRIIGQNFKFDRWKLETASGFKVPAPYWDTQYGFHAIYPEFPKSLEFQTSIMTREPYYKSEGHEFDIRKDPIEQRYIYNGKDVCVTKEIQPEQEKIMDKICEMLQWPEWKDQFFHGFMMKLHDLYMEIEEKGILVNKEVRVRLWEKYDALEVEFQNRLDRLAGKHINVESKGQNGQVSKFLFGDLKLPFRDSTDEDALTAILANHCSKDEQRKAVEDILAIRRIRKTKSTYILSQPDYDGRMRTAYRETGTESGRTSTTKVTSKKGGPLRPTKDIGLAFQTMTKYGDYGYEVREMLEPDPGKEFIEIDGKQAEARVVALLARDYELLKMLDTIDVHKLTASWCFDIPIDKITPEQRYIGKKVRHAGAYGEGKRRLMIDVMSESRRFHIDIMLSEWKAGKILDKFHEKTPNIRGVYHKEIEEFVKKYRYLVSPFGRFRGFYDHFGNDLLKESFAQIPQATVSDNTKRAMLEAKKVIPKLEILIESHDGFLIQCDKSASIMRETALILKEKMEMSIDFSRCSLPRDPLIIPCEISMGTNYKEMEKIKL